MDEAQVKPEPDIQMGGGAGKNKFAAALAYIGPFVAVSYLMAKDEPFVKFHIKQGLLLLVAWVAVWLIGSAFWGFGIWMFWGLVRLAISVFSIIGIVNAVKGEEKELPWIGQYGKYFKF